jgi:hypothetical protein
MTRHCLMGSALALALASVVPASAGNFARPTSNLPIQTVGCAVGAHIGPLGACVIGTEDPQPVVVEQRAADVPLPPVRDESTTRTMTQDSNGCATKTIEKNDGMGNSAAKTQSNC